jgi:hypothetical protein
VSFVETMEMKKTPRAERKERFARRSHVAAVEHLATDELWIDRSNANQGLLSVSTRSCCGCPHPPRGEGGFGSRAKLIDAILDLDGAAKDPGLARAVLGLPDAAPARPLPAATRRSKHAA